MGDGEKRRIARRWAKRAQDVRRAQELRAQGRKLREIAEDLNVATTTVWIWLNLAKPPAKQTRGARPAA